MADTTTSSFNQQEKIGRKRFLTGIEFEKIIANLSKTIQGRLLERLPSNYSQDVNTNLAELYRAVSEEFARLQTSISDINTDQYHDTTRAQYLYEILGDTLFLDDKNINYSISDEAYRNFLITVRNAYFGGSRKDNIEQAVSDILGIPVTIKEVYLELRKSDSSYTLKDTNKMFFDILMDYVSNTSSLGLVLENIKYFLDLIKPAHVLYDTRLIWSDTFINRDGSCKPEYVEKDMEGIIYGVDKIYMLTYVVDSLYVFNDTDPRERWESGVIASKDDSRGLLYLEENRTLVVNTQSKLYSRTVDPLTEEITDTTITYEDLTVGDTVKYYATVDSSDTSTVITTDWLYEDAVVSVDISSETILLASGRTIVYNEDVLVYTRDKNGEYRIFITGLIIGHSIKFKGTEYTKAFDFYQIPEEVQQNSYKQFDPEVIVKPTFQDYVKKVPETINDLPLGPDVVVEDGVARVVDVDSKFYKRADSKNYKSFYAYRYSLYIEGVFEEQFTIEEPATQITEEQAKVVFETAYGYTGIANSDYRIDISTTALLKETTDDPTVQAIDDQTEFCDRRAECHLIPSYEDTRKYHEYPDIQLTSGFITTVQIEASINNPGEHNIPGYFKISSDPNSYAIGLLPLLNSQGSPASESDLVVYVNGLKVDDAVQYVNPWTGELILNFLPPANSTIRIDYYYAKRYPSKQTYIEKVGETLSSHRLQWPFPVTGLYGGPEDFQVNFYPILDQQGNLATPSDVQTYIGDLGVTGLITSKIDIGASDILVADVGVSGINVGETIIISAQDSFDNTIIYSIVGVTGTNEIITDKKFSVEITSPGLPFEIVRFTGISNAVNNIRPLLGHLHLTGAPETGTYVKFDYYYTNSNRTYTLIPDVAGETGPFMNQGYASDTFYGNHNGFTLVPDEGLTGSESPIFDSNQVAKKGYRYRAFNLSNSSVLDSKDTLVLDGYYRKTGNASWANNRNRLDQYDLLFSPEYLTDRDKNIVLNDKYLEKDLEPATKLYPGTPLFVETYSDDAHFKGNVIPESENTYQEPSDTAQDLSAGFTIIGDDTSGLVDYQSVCDYKQNKRIRLYSGLKIVERDYEGFQGPLTTITEGQRSLPFRTVFIDSYYPNREQRLNDYLDYINRVPEEIKTGSIKVLKNSVVVKRVEGNWLLLKKGDMFNIKDVPFRVYNNSSHEWEIEYKDIIYTVIKIIDYETAELSSTFKQNSGEYEYVLIRDTVYNVDVYLNEVNRMLILNGIENYTYGLPASMLTSLPSYGVTGEHSEFYFPDPDKDPYPRSPDNPNITGLPTGIRATLVTHETGLGPTDSGLIPLIREIIGADGNSVSYGLTGDLTGFTGPSGAVDLGLTGPTGDNNPRILDGDDKYVIPSGATGVYWSTSEAEYRVNWRNWDQEILFINFGPLTGPNAGVILEEPVNMMNDLGEGIKRAYWSVTDEELQPQYYFGTLFETSELVASSVVHPETTYPYCLILLDPDQAKHMVQPDMDNTVWDVRKRIVREILQDSSIKITEIYEITQV